MKTSKLLIAIALLSFVTSNAQITKGNWLMGGNGNFSFSKTKGKDNNNELIINNNSDGETIGIILEPNIGYFIKDKLAIGLKVGFENNFSTQFSFQLNQTQFSFSPFIRYYLLDVDKSFNLFIEPSYNKYTYKPLGNSDGYGLKFGHVYFLNSSVGIETSFNYQHNESDQLQTNKLFLAFGFQLYLEKK